VTRTCCFRLAVFGLTRWTRLGSARHALLLLALPLALWATPARSHDASAWGGLFRSRDHGATWVSANRAQIVAGAIALAISPTDADHLLLGAESGLLRSRNGGRDWTIEAPAVVVGPVFALAFAADGQRTLVSTGLGIFCGAGNSWRQVSAPQGIAPARAIVRSGVAGREYLAGWAGLYRSDDWGASWSNVARGLPHETATALLEVHGSPEILYAVIQGGIWASDDGARSWTSRGGIFPASVDALAVDSQHPTRLWAAGGDRLFKSDDGGASWQRIGRTLPEPNTTVRGIAAGEEAVVVTTDRGLYRTIDGGASWTMIVENVPAHLEAGPLVRDPGDSATLYAGFALVPYPEIWRRAAEREGAFARLSVISLAGGGIFLLIVALGALAALRWLGQFYRPSSRGAPPTRSPRDHRMEKIRS
jgi:photosystem II stability/assembly factor-like uncharacterized protein